MKAVVRYHPHSKNVHWPTFKKNVVKLMEEFGCSYKLKHDLEVLG